MFNFNNVNFGADESNNFLLLPFLDRVCQNG